MARGYRDRLIWWFTFLGGLYFFLEFVLPREIFGFEFGKYNDEVTNGFILLSTMAFGLGFINLFLIHGTKIAFVRKGWSNSLALLLGLIAMIILTSADWVGSERINQQTGKFRTMAEFARLVEGDFKTDQSSEELRRRSAALLTSLQTGLAALPQFDQPELRDAASQLSASASGLQSALGNGSLADDPAQLISLAEQLVAFAALYGVSLQAVQQASAFTIGYHLLFDGLYVALGSAMFSLLGFYIVSAAYRAFRVRSWESALMMLAAVLVMLGQIPFYTYIHDDLPLLRAWLLEVPNSGAFRAIQFGAGIAGLVMAIRVWLSIESESFISAEGE